MREFNQLDTSNQIYIRDPRATMQGFQVAEAMELTAVNLLIRRAMEGAQFTISLRDFGTTAPADSLAAGLGGSTQLASFSHTVTAGQVFGNSSGPVTVADPFNTMTWTLASSVNLVPGNFYGLVFDGTNVTTGTPHIIIPYALGNAYAGGLGYYQNGNSADFAAGGGIFGEGNNLQADFALALVPEPRTYGLLLGALAIGFVILRRRQ